MSGLAGRTDYETWQKKTTALVDQAEEDDEKEKEESRKALGLDGKYAVSQAEAEERQKAQGVEKMRKTVDKYREREGSIMQTYANLFPDKEDGNSKDSSHVIRLTRDRLDAGKRVVTISDTNGCSEESNKIILTQDLSLLESKLDSNKNNEKKYNDDAENDVQEKPQQERTIYGLIKLFISNVHNCTIVVRCKIISGTVELSHCSNVTIKLEKETTVPTSQANLCENLSIQFYDTPSGLKGNLPGKSKLFWGDDKDDRIFHAGIKGMKVAIFRDGFLETECSCDYTKDAAEVIGNATKEEYQFITSVMDGSLQTEKVVRNGSATGKNARAMTQRELDIEKMRRDEAAKIVVAKAEDMIKIIGKDGREVPKKNQIIQDKEKKKDEKNEEIYTSMSKSEIDSIVAGCEQDKKRGNEAFSAGEYGQAILHYTLVLDKAEELPDKGETGDGQLFPRHIIFSNRSAAFLKLGAHEKALDDGIKAEKLNPTYVKGVFRKGLALHAMGRYQEAIQALAAANKVEPKNKQIKQALQFAEVRMTQETRKRMNS
eukprot:CAMPEP_0194132618 /NCGR_PEP_ID=MMETSP0152-20130528/3040_1 /TAXON_ID=1049557 /ORGANISM="Thalassiothrix antarctica, Strain L6-D1" /LENGTH=543 /DNA_ID=CAMNT_0038827727 /DNA_START=49 /DNA_END=1680 /DNA_ORIENTATION=+